MNFQEKLLEASAEIRARATAFAAAARKTANDRARLVTVLDGARREFAKVTRRHAGQFLRQNSTLAAAVGKDVSELARATYASLSTPAAAKPATRKKRRTATARKRSAKAA